METTSVITPKTLVANPNPVMIQPGVLTRAENCRRDKRGILRKRRGQQRISPEDHAGLAQSVGNTVPIKIWWYNGKLWQICYSAAQDRTIIGYMTDVLGTGSWRYSYLNAYGWAPNLDGSNPGDYRPGDTKFRYPVTEAFRRLVVGTNTGAMCSPKLETDYLITKASTTLATPQTSLVLAGCPRGLQLTASMTDTAATYNANWLASGSKVSYRTVWKKVDENGIVTIGAPSNRRVFTNSAGASRAVSITAVPIPKELSDAYAAGDYQYAATFQCDIYRTRSSAVDGTGVAPDPGDEHFLVTSYFPTATDFTAKYFAITDITHDSVLGEPLYTNETVDGALAERIRPPVYMTSEVYADTLFFANTIDKWVLDFQVLAVADTVPAIKSGILADDIIVIGNYVVQAKAAAVNTWEFNLDTTAGVASQTTRVKNTVENIISLYALYQDVFILTNTTGPNDPYGSIRVEERMIGGSTRPFLAIGRLENPSAFSPVPLVRYGSSQIGKAYKITQVDGTTEEIITDSQPDFAVGDVIHVVDRLGTATSEISSFIGEKTVTAITNLGGGNWGVKCSGCVATGTLAAGFYGAFHCIKANSLDGSPVTAAVGTRNIKPNRVYFSPIREPECTTPVNWFDVGRDESEILRLIRLNDTLFVFKEDGLFRVNGYENNFVQTLYDSTCVLISPQSVDAAFGGLIAFTQQGIVKITESTIEPISEEIDDYIMDLVYNSRARCVDESFAVGYDDDGCWNLWIPNSYSGSDVCFVYDGEGWTTRQDNAVSGCVGTDTDNDATPHLFLARNATNWITKDRKTLTPLDYYDELITITKASSDLMDIGDGTSLIRITHGNATFYNEWLYRILGYNLDGNGFSGAIIEMSGGTLPRTTRYVVRSGRQWATASNYDEFIVDIYATDTPGKTAVDVAADFAACTTVKIALPIRMFVSFAADRGQELFVEQLVSEVRLHLDRPVFTTGTLGFYTDKLPVGTSTVDVYGMLNSSVNSSASGIWDISYPSGSANSASELVERNLIAGYMSFPVPIPRNALGNGALEFYVYHNIAQQDFRLLGYSVVSLGSNNKMRPNR